MTDADALARFIGISALLTGFDDLDARVAAAHLVRLRERPTYRAGLDAVLARVSPDAPPSRALIDELNAEGATIVVITHEHEIAARFPRQISLLDGRVVFDGRKEQTVAYPRPHSSSKACSS